MVKPHAPAPWRTAGRPRTVGCGTSRDRPVGGRSGSHAEVPRDVREQVDAAGQGRSGSTRQPEGLRALPAEDGPALPLLLRPEPVGRSLDGRGRLAGSAVVDPVQGIDAAAVPGTGACAARAKDGGAQPGRGAGYPRRQTT
ncbi:hypothetical protein GCM10010371_10990 [Streptomyces subrutilus]|uniref:Uncharacterized protein n=1 Tax=Streptomyces subrutilus TaxID=36818 RepID=A0A918QLI1_9ACTN|nr:hypothetical protein GCM10010371_10990 [Streptomyces subrutilus]